MDSVKITILIDDINGAKEGFLLSYGFAVLIQKNNKNILFDTGTKTTPLLKNLSTYGISPSELDAVILSHNHFDHTNGLSGLLTENHDLPVYVHKDWDQHVSYEGSQVPERNKKVNPKARECKDICPDFFLTNSHTSGDYGGIHEQACYIKTPSSYILICGCCHPGLIHFLSDRSELDIQEDAPLHILGGLHGFKFQNEEAKQFNPIIKSITLCHCTMNANIFRSQFGDKCVISRVGDPIIFN